MRPMTWVYSVAHPIRAPDEGGNKWRRHANARYTRGGLFKRWRSGGGRMSCQTFEGTLAPGAPASLMCSAGVCNMPLSQNDISIADTETPAAPRYLVTLEDLTRNQSGALRMDAGEVSQKLHPTVTPLPTPFA